MYLETDSPINLGSSGNGGLGGGWGDGFWGIILIALLFGWGRNGYGSGFGGQGGSGSEFVGYELGKVATQADIASGFNNSAVLSSLNDIKLGQSSMQNFINQGFAGLNTALVSEFRGTDNAICTLGYNVQSGFNGLSREIAECCCSTKQAIADVKYANERNTCDIIQAINAGNQRLVDIYTSDKLDALRSENATLKGKLSNDAQTTQIISALAPKQPIPAYPVFPTTSFAYPSGVTFGVGSNCGCNTCGI